MVLSIRDIDGKRVDPILIPYTPYFYYPEYQQNMWYSFIKQNPVLRDSILKEERGYKSTQSFPLVKVYVRYPYTVKEITNLTTPFQKRTGKYFHLHESNILFTKRFLIDKKLYTGINDKLEPVEIESKHRKIYLDIEVEGEEEWKDETYKYKIIIIGLYDPVSNTYYQFYIGENIEIFKEDPACKYVLIPCKDEEDLYIKLSEKWSEISPDVVVTFSPFDMGYILNRLKILGMNYSFLSPIGVVTRGPHFHCLDVLDYALLYRKVVKEQVWHTLDYIAKKELGYGKIILEDKIYKTWKINKKAVLEYNLRDVKLLKDLEEKLHFIRDYIIPIWEITGLPFSDCLGSNKIADILYLRDSSGREVWKSYSYIKASGYKGALVIASPGIYDYILVMDWSELYPSLMETFHISWDTYTKLMGDIKLGENLFFSSREEGQSNRLVRPLRERRQLVKKWVRESIDKETRDKFKRLSDALKSIINACSYGIYGYQSKNGYFGSRLYEPNVAAAITLMERIIFNEVSRYVKEIEYEMVYGDTDSLFVQLKTEDHEKESKEILEKIQDHIDKFIEDNYHVPSKLKISIEYILKRVIIITKKRYQGVTIEGEEVVKGIEVVRMESAPITSIVEKAIGNLILNYKEDDIGRYTESIKRDIINKKIPLEDIAIRPRCTKDEYKTLTRNYKAVKICEEYTKEKIKKGNRFFLFHIVPKKTMKVTIGIGKEKKEVNIFVNIIGLKRIEDLPKEFEIDYPKTIEYTVTSPVQKYLDAIKSKRYKQRSLFDYR